jgi:signal transduction histidine kinase
VLAEWWRSRPVPVQDGAVALVFLVLAAVPGVAGLGIALGELPQRPFDGTAVALIVAQALPLVVRRRWPLVCLAVVAVAFAVHEVVRCPPTFASTALIVALYSAGAHRERDRRVAAAVATVGYAVLAVVLAHEGSPEHPFDFFTFYVLLAACTGAGTRVRAWRIVERRQRGHEAEAARAQERTVIARELHDVVTHHVTAMVVQAEAAQFLLGTPERAAAGLSAVSDTGRLALSELRQLLNLLDTTGHGDTVDAAAARTPAIGRLSDLVERTRLSGQPVELAETGERGTPDARVVLAAYRVVQEGLTNAVKHARGLPTSVRVHYSAEEIDVVVDTAGTAVADPVPGRGLTGLRERVGLLGGRLDAVGRPGGGVTVHARIPTGGVS